MEWYFEFARDNGAMTNAEYPYTAKDGDCAWKESSNNIKVEGWETVAAAYAGDQYGSVAQIRAALENGPLTMALAAGNNTIFNYKSGILTADDGCPDNTIDHAIVIVGYGIEEGEGNGGETCTTQEVCRVETECWIEEEEDCSNCNSASVATDPIEYCRKSTRRERRNQQCDESTNPDWNEYFKTSKPFRNKCCIQMDVSADDDCECDIV